MWKTYVFRTLAAGLFAVAGAFSGPAVADNTSQSATVDGMTVYYGIIPADQLRSFPKGTAEARAHARIPKGKHVYHLVVAVFEGKGMNRVADADVVARVHEIGLGAQKKHLSPTSLDGAVTYCNYFELQDHARYKIDIDVRRPEAPDDIVTASLDYENE